jgi:photosystem II stability/assembly factor-like uncharacterized protein
LRTENGGFRWQKQSSPSEVTFSGVFVKDKKNAVIVGARGSIFTTDNGGKDWHRSAIETKDHLYGIVLTGENFLTGWTVGTYGRILKTTDGGATWQNQASGTSEQLLEVTAFDAQKSIIVGTNGAVLSTINGGESWKISKPCENFLVSNAAYLSSEKIVVAGYGGCVAQSLDDGETGKKSIFLAAPIFSRSRLPMKKTVL